MHTFLCVQGSRMLPVLSQRLADKEYSLFQMLRHTVHALRLLLQDRLLLSPQRLRQLR